MTLSKKKKWVFTLELPALFTIDMGCRWVLSKAEIAQILH